MNTLLEDLQQLAQELDDQIGFVVERFHTRHRLAHTRPYPSIYQEVYKDDKPIMSDLLVAKAQVLHAITMVKTSEPSVAKDAVLQESLKPENHTIFDVLITRFPEWKGSANHLDRILEDLIMNQKEKT